jgi:hypothetical protein
LYRIQEGKRQLWRRKCKWEDITALVLKERRYAHANWDYLIQDRFKWRNLVNTVINFRIP